MAQAKMRMDLSSEVTKNIKRRNYPSAADVKPSSLREPYRFSRETVDGMVDALSSLFEERPAKRSPVGRTRVNFRIDTDTYDRLTVACAVHKVRQQDVVELALDAVLAALDRIDGR